VKTNNKISNLNKMRSLALKAGGKKNLDKQLAKGKLSARERLNILLDKHTFTELDMFVKHDATNFNMSKNKILTDGVITGYGKINGIKVFVFSQDFTIFGGSLSKACAKKICKIMDLAIKSGVPIIGLNDSGGARIQEGIDSLAGYADIFLKNTLASGVVPQISAILGPCAGGAVYSPAITDFIFMVENTSHMFVTGPRVVKTVTHEKITMESLGGANTHSSKSGVSHFCYDNEIDLLQGIRTLLTYLPSNNVENTPKCSNVIEPQIKNDEIDTIIPDNINKPYDMYKIINAIFDSKSFFEIHAQFAKNLIVGFARINGQCIGIVANQPNYLAGVLDIDASVKGARFVRFCDAFNIPIITFEDVPGFLPGSDQEWRGIIKHGAKLLYAYCEATVPKLTIITRKAYGGAFDVMSSKNIRGDLNFAWPSAEIAVMGAEGAVEILWQNKSKLSNQEYSKLVENYKNNFLNPYIAAEKGYIDDIIKPHETRKKLISGLEILINKVDNNPSKKHGNIPL
tara:strand:- start:1325 stop:2866 length:1542 start_codon:yes stop_codon:yes gene_type:complete